MASGAGNSIVSLKRGQGDFKSLSTRSRLGLALAARTRLQDFGYWHDTGRVLFPKMGSCMIAVTRKKT